MTALDDIDTRHGVETMGSADAVHWEMKPPFAPQPITIGVGFETDSKHGPGRNVRICIGPADPDKVSFDTFTVIGIDTENLEKLRDALDRALQRSRS